MEGKIKIYKNSEKILETHNTITDIGKEIFAENLFTNKTLNVPIYLAFGVGTFNTHNLALLKDCNNPDNYDILLVGRGSTGNAPATTNYVYAQKLILDKKYVKGVPEKILTITVYLKPTYEGAKFKMSLYSNQKPGAFDCPNTILSDDNGNKVIEGHTRRGRGQFPPGTPVPGSERFSSASENVLYYTINQLNDWDADDKFKFWLIIETTDDYSIVNEKIDFTKGDRTNLNHWTYYYTPTGVPLNKWVDLYSDEAHTQTYIYGTDYELYFDYGEEEKLIRRLDNGDIPIKGEAYADYISLDNFFISYYKETIGDYHCRKLDKIAYPNMTPTNWSINSLAVTGTLDVICNYSTTENGDSIKQNYLAREIFRTKATGVYGESRGLTKIIATFPASNILEYSSAESFNAKTHFPVTEIGLFTESGKRISEAYEYGGEQKIPPGDGILAEEVSNVSRISGVAGFRRYTPEEGFVGNTLALTQKTSLSKKMKTEGIEEAKGKLEIKYIDRNWIAKVEDLFSSESLMETPKGTWIFRRDYKSTMPEYLFPGWPGWAKTLLTYAAFTFYRIKEHIEEDSLPFAVFNFSIGEKKQKTIKKIFFTAKLTVADETFKEFYFTKAKEDRIAAKRGKKEDLFEKITCPTESSVAFLIYKNVREEVESEELVQDPLDPTIYYPSYPIKALTLEIERTIEKDNQEGAKKFITDNYYSHLENNSIVYDYGNINTHLYASYEVDTTGMEVGWIPFKVKHNQKDEYTLSIESKDLIRDVINDKGELQVMIVGYDKLSIHHIFVECAPIEEDYYFKKWIDYNYILGDNKAYWIATGSDGGAQTGAPPTTPITGGGGGRSKMTSPAITEPYLGGRYNVNFSVPAGRMFASGRMEPPIYDVGREDKITIIWEIRTEPYRKD